MGIVRFALRWPYTFYVVALLILFLGVTAFRSMPADIFPEIDIPVVTVIWQETGLSTQEMEQRITTYSEYSISSNVNGIKDIETQTLTGISVQKIYFQPDVNLDLAIAQIVSATNAIRALLPPGIQPPIVVRKGDAVDRRQMLSEIVQPVIIELLLVESVRAQADLQHRNAGCVVLHHDRRLDAGRQQGADRVGGRHDLRDRQI
ncbi:MAG TPA: efflux RND transporter permease subunit, partial [Stellaceae bacterium]|nr:efflux RND transporter permease subunit [Stellaceae bacterium]